jgi:hypothetical protein
VTVRALGLVTLLTALVLVGAMLMLAARRTGPTYPRGRQAIDDAQQSTAGIDFAQAAVQLEAFRTTNGTYVGVTLPTSFRVVLVRSDTASYCLQSGAGSAVRHEVGPGGTVASGPC